MGIPIMSIIINTSKAKDIWRNKWREARRPLLEQLDVQFMRSVEAQDTAEQARIAGLKQQLRDVTLTALPDSVDEIKQVWPAILNEGAI